jgi:hypothetical protein
MTDTDLSRLGSIDKEQISNATFKLNAKKAKYSDIEKINSIAKVILDMILDFIYSKDKSILDKEIILRYQPTKLDKDLIIETFIPESFIHRYKVTVVSNNIHIYDFYENYSITVELPVQNSNIIYRTGVSKK